MASFKEMKGASGKYELDGKWMRIKDNRQCCSEEGCLNLAYFSSKEKTCGKCSAHIPSMKKRLCNQDGCSSSAEYNYEGEKRASYCRLHKKEKMICTRLARCIQEGCSKSASFNYEGNKKRLYCVDHKLITMVSCYGASKKQTINICSEPDCSSRARYVFYLGGDKKVYCRKHKPPGALDGGSRKCCVDDCNDGAFYVDVDDKDKFYCIEHNKILDASRTKLCKQKCTETDCIRLPKYGLPNTYPPTSCNLHRSSEMCITRRQRRCSFAGCERLAHFNFDGLTPIFCSLHRELGMRRTNRRRCHVQDCNLVTWVSSREYDHQGVEC